MFVRKQVMHIWMLAAWLIGLVCNSPGIAQDWTRNSTRKIRVKPDALAAKAGTAVNWAADFEKAVEKSAATGKPVFWYVPTIRGTFTDRKPVIDRYMMAGLFSIPEFIKTLNENFVPVKAVPTRGQQKHFELTRYKFIEPGFLILSGENTAEFKIDRITTQHPVWFSHLFNRFGGNCDIEELEMRFRYENVVNQSNPPRWPANPDESTVTELAYETLFAGMSAFRKGEHEVARTIWRSLADRAPNHPLTWKAAAEAQGIGPFVRGFEVYANIPAASLKAGIVSAGSAAPAGTYSERELWQRGTNFLFGMQNKNGGYVDSDYDFGGTDSLPNVHVAVTALVGMALLDARSRISEPLTKKLNDAIERCFQFVSDERNLNQDDRDEILWADTYRLRFLCRYRDAIGKDVSQQIQSATKSLENLQSRRGTWYHEYQNPFVTATALAALYEAKTAGAEINQSRIELGLAALAKDRFQSGSFPYYSSRNRPASEATIAESAGRMPICELALLRWGRSDQQKLVHAVNSSFEFHKHLNVALKYDNHTSTMGYGGFFFWYDMRSRSEAISAINDKALRDQFLRQQKEIVLALPEIDGCFVDSHELGRCYGTAMALMCLAAAESAGSN